MDNDTGEWIIKTIAALGGWKILEWIFNWREKKRKSIADVVAVETDPLIKRYTAMESEMENLRRRLTNFTRKFTSWKWRSLNSSGGTWNLNCS